MSKGAQPGSYTGRYEHSKRKCRSLERANEALRHAKQALRLLADNVPALFAYVDSLAVTAM